MQYVGIQSQISRNNRYSFLLLIAFPTLLLGMFYIFFFFAENQYFSLANEQFLRVLPGVLIAVLIWFLIAYAGHTAFIRLATSSRPLERNENMRVYNLVENLCIQCGMVTPKIFIIYDDSLNAFASGVNQKTYSVTLSKGIIDKLNDDELEAVIAHELTHIRNKDTRLLIISIIFVGIFAFLAQMALRSLRFTSGSKKKDGGYIILIAIAVTAVCYLISLLLRFGISRRREYLADAGSAEMTKKPYALANALRKIDNDPLIEAVHNEDVAQLFIDNPQKKNKSFFARLFATHPPIEKRIQLLDQFV
ncbi:MAG: M48 family metallopeptidase [Bacteroidetes bacterium]|nr:M48 family metallopeptidase [Bacteroidota bacterium]MBS1633821.1 M48 family metallopeptidase [Bacteroidota bacterium]